MKRFTNLLALLVLASACAFAVDHPNLLINITVTITETNSIEWSQPAVADVTADRTWTIAAATRNTAYASTAGAITATAGAITGGDDTALNFTNKGEIPVTATITVANGTTWNPGAAPGANVFQLNASVTGAAPFNLAMTPSATLNVALAKDANCDLALQFTTPTSVTSKTNTSVVTITAVQN